MAPGTTAWTFAANDLDLDFLAAGDRITWSHTVTATDVAGAVATDAVTFRIDGTNDAAVISVPSCESYTFLGETAGDLAGVRVAMAGDVDGDGRQDVLIGTGEEGSVTGGGQAYLVFAEDLARLDAADGSSDRVIRLVNVGATHGGYRIESSVPSNVLTTVAAAGDVDGDGFDDILIGRPDEFSGHVGLLRASDLDLLDTKGGSEAADGRIDLFDIYQGPAGHIFLHSTNRDWAGENFGFAMTGVPDIDGDGLDEILISNYDEDRSGEIFLVFGSEIEDFAAHGDDPGEPPYRLASMEDLPELVGLGVLTGYLFSGNFPSDSGYSMATAARATGGADFLIGAPSYDGKVYLFHSGTLAQLDTRGGTVTADGQIYLPNVASHGGYILKGTAGTYPGVSTAFTGDIDGDGRAEILIGASGGSERVSFIPTGALDALDTKGGTLAADGEIDLADVGLHGGYVFEGSTAGDSVLSVGDLDGDGLGEIVIGAPSFDASGAINSGAVYVIPSRALATLDAAGAGGVDGHIALADVGVHGGFRLDGVLDGDLAGTSLGGTLDGTLLLVGAPEVDSTGTSDNAGAAYLVDLAALLAAGATGGSLPLGTPCTGGADAGEMTEDGAPTVTGRLAVADPDGPARFIARTDTTKSYGRFEIDADGTWSFTADFDDPVYDTLDAGDQATVAFTVHAADGTAGTVTVTIDGADEAGSVNYTFRGEAAGDRVGANIAIAGDVDGDGLQDYLISADIREGVTTGAVYLVFGQTLADLDAADSVVDGTIDLAHVGLAHGGYRIEGSYWWTESIHFERESEITSGARDLPPYPLTVSRAGDIDNDGLEDILIGAPYWAFDGAYGILLKAQYLDELDALAVPVTGGSPGTDGVINLESIFQGEDVLPESAGYIIHQQAPGTDTGLASITLGNAFAPLGDLDGNGLGDFLVSNHNYAGGARAEVYLIFGEDLEAVDNAGQPLTWGDDSYISLGNDFRPLVRQDTVTSLIIRGYDGTGYALAAAAPTDGTGGMDLLIGAHEISRTYWVNTALILSEAVDAPGDERNNTVQLTDLVGQGAYEIVAPQRWWGNDNRESGWSVSFVGDIDGDGRSDILFGRPGDATETVGGTTVYNGGEVYLIPTTRLDALDRADDLAGAADGTIEVESLGTVNGGYVFEWVRQQDEAGQAVGVVGVRGVDENAGLLIGAPGDDHWAGDSAAYLIPWDDLDALDRAGSVTGDADGRIRLADVATGHGGFRFDDVTVDSYVGADIAASVGSRLFLLGAPGAAGNAGETYLIDIATLDRISDANGVITLGDIRAFVPRPPVPAEGAVTMTGGAGADRFVIADDPALASVTIAAFDPGEGDRLDLSAFAFDDFAAVQAALTQQGADSHIQLDPDSVLILAGFAPDLLAPAHVILEV